MATGHGAIGEVLDVFLAQNEVAGTPSDVVRRQSAGHWLFAIDNHLGCSA